jgi:hypothetical protein
MRTCLTVLAALWALAGHAADADRQVLVAQAEAEKAPKEPTNTFTYKPRGGPATRVGGGTRSIGSSHLTVSVLAPNETGFTTRDDPTVYWYVSEPLTTPVELTLTSTEPLKDAVPTALELTLQPPIARGVHALRLSDHGVTLKPGVEYQWFVAVVTNPAQRSSDVVSGGGIKRIAAGEAAQDGIWYDTIDQLSRAISANPADARLRQQRAALLEQVGLREAAAFDRSNN